MLRVPAAGDLTSELLDAVELVLALPGGSPDPVAVIGLGFGGALAVYVASRHPYVRAVVCYDGFRSRISEHL